MIRRDEGDDFLLIRQTDHAAVAAKLISFWGNTRFAPPSPRADLVAAAAHHDDGWPLHDDAPTLNDAELPMDLFETPRLLSIRIWQASADRATEAAGDYAGLLVSLHSLALSIYTNTRKNPDDKPFDPTVLARQFAVNKFQHRELERQEQLRTLLKLRTDIPLQHGLADPHTTIADDELRFAFRQLQAVDLLSLCLCCTQPTVSKIDPVIPRPGEDPVKLKVHRDSAGVLRISPWPFDVRLIELTVPAKRLPSRTWKDETEFRSCYTAAAVEKINVVAGA